MKLLQDWAVCAYSIPSLWKQFYGAYD